MIKLLLDSSDKRLVVAIAQGDKIIDCVDYEAWQKQSEFMVLEIDNLLNKNNLTRKDIESVSVGKGPGSYTGVRISMSIAAQSVSSMLATGGFAVVLALVACVVVLSSVMVPSSLNALISAVKYSDRRIKSPFQFCVDCLKVGRSIESRSRSY